MTLYGWDASNHDWDPGRGNMLQAIPAARKAGVAFFTHKIGEGNRFYEDEFFQRGMDAARAASYPILGPYFVNHGGDQAAQVDWMLAMMDAKTPWLRKHSGLIIQLDAEKFDYMDRPPSIAECNAFQDRVRAKTGLPVEALPIYAPRWIYGDAVAGLRYPWWQSDYSSNPDKWAAVGGKVPTILQDTSTATMGGNYPADRNIVRVQSEAALAALFKRSITLNLDADDQKFITDSLNRTATSILYGDGRDDLLAKAGKSETHPWNIETIFNVVTALKADSVKVLTALDTLKTAVNNTPTNADLKLELDDAVATLEAYIIAHPGGAVPAVTDEQLDASFRRVLASVADKGA